MNMEILKPNDILVATLSNPQLTPYDLLSNDITGENTSLKSKDDYKQSEYIQKAFRGEDGKFDDISFNKAYDLAQNNFYQLTNEEYLQGLDEIQYSPFDITRPKYAKTFNVTATLEKEYNPFKERKGWTGIGSVDPSDLSLRELAQQNKIFDPKTGEWSDKSLNDLSILNKMFGDTLVYAQYDEDGNHLDYGSGLMVNHKKGDWKVSEDGNLFIEKLAGREVYGKQVVNPMDTLTTDGSLMNKFDFLDSDGRSKSIAGTAFKVGLEIAPFLIPSFGVFKGMYAIPSIYGSIKAAVGLTTAMPTLYKSFEGLLMGDNDTTLTQGATELEGWLSKYTQRSVSDEASQSLFNVEQMTGMIGDIFSQIYEQRAAASLSKLIYRGDKAINAETQKMAAGINQKLITSAIEGKINFDDIGDLSKAAMEKIPTLKTLIDKQSQLSKALSLGYMALTSTSDIYGQAILGGYDKRTAGFAALAAATGQYGIMMNNRMGTWFLDKTTGYSTETNKALMRKAIVPWLDDVEKGFKTVTQNSKEGKKQLANSFSKIKNSIHDIFTTPSAIGEAMWKNALVEGAEEVTEQVVLDATKGMIDTLSYLGLTKKEGTFGGWQNVFSKQGFENYLANFVGGILGGGMFEFHRARIAPWLDPNMLAPDTQKSLYEIIAAGEKNEVINYINSKRHTFGNSYITAVNQDGSFQEAGENSISQADLIADKAIEMVNVIDGILNSHDLIHTDDEIINKAIMDKMIINDLKKATVEGSNIGLEGIVLEDYKTKMSEIVRIEAAIKNIEDKPENQKAIKSLKDSLKINVQDVNDILEGKQGSKYFGEAMFYLNKKLNTAFLKMSKTDFAQEKYNVNFNELEEAGLGITQTFINEKWDEFIKTKDLRKDLDVAYKVFLGVEKLLNPSIAEYAESGYDISRKETLQNVMDLKETIALFNTSKDLEEKNKALQRFIEINNQLDSGKTIAPWTVLHNDMYDQINDLGLIKKATYIKDVDGQVTYKMDSFTDAELEESIGQTDAKRKDYIKNIIQGYFKQFSINPLNAEQTIQQLNSEMEKHNVATLKKITALEQKEDKTPEDIENIAKLEGTMFNFKIDSFNNTPEIQHLISNASTEFNNSLINKSITQAQFDNYRRLKSNSTSYEANFNQLLEKFGTTSWKELDAKSLNELIDTITGLGIFSEAMASITAASVNSETIIMEALTKLGSDELTDEEFAEIKEVIDPFMTLVINKTNEGNELLNDENYEELQKEWDKIDAKLTKDTESAKPEILKLHNYALDLLIKQLSAGNSDKEVFLEAEKLVEEEILKLGSLVFPDAKNLSYENLVKLIEVTQEFIDNIETEHEEARQAEAAGMDNSDNYSNMDYLKDVIKKEEAAYLANPNHKGLFPNKEYLNFVKNNFDDGLILGTLKESLKTSLQSFSSNKTIVDRINKFLEMQSKGITLKSNSLYDFIRKFELTLDSNTNSKVNKIFDILEREETNLKSASNITNYLSDNIREQDLDQAINHLQIISSVIEAMSTTEVNFGDPYGFIQSRKNYAEKYNQEDDVLGLKTITSDVATLMVQDVEVLITRLRFLKDLAGFNAGKRMNEEELIRGRVDEILIDNWKVWITTMNPSFLPIDKIKEILGSSETSSSKVMKIENAVFDHNVSKKEDALAEFLKHLQNVDSDNFSQIDKDVNHLESWDLAVYLATVLAMRAEDFQIRSLLTINGDFNKAPFYTQELAARVIKASTVNPLLFSKIYEIKANSSKKMADFITILLGGSGTGKTSTVFGLDLDNFRQTNESTNVWLVAPENTQKLNLSKSITDSVGTNKITTSASNKSELFEKLGLTDIVNTIVRELNDISDDTIEKKYVKSENGSIMLTDEILNNEWIQTEVGDRLENLPNLLLIDEITHFSSFEIYLLNAISKHSYHTDSLNFMKIIAAGDPTQLGHLVKVKEDSYSYNVDDINAIFTPRLWSSVRASNSQKRINDDRYKRVTKELTKIYEVNKNDYSKSSSDSLAYLESNKALNTLSYFQDENKLSGDRIVKSLDKELVSLLAKAKLENPNIIIGILTKDGALPEEWNQLLSNAGIITQSDMSSIRLFRPSEVQGSEVDYFIFDAGLITSYDKVRDNIKAFYTYMSRSKHASIIVDSENVLDKFSISNGKKDGYSATFEPLTDSVIKDAKTKRSEALTTLLGSNPVPSKHDDFKWKVGGLQVEEPITGSFFVTENPPDLSEIKPTGNNKEEVEYENKILTKDFKVMLHSFYNNPGAVVNEKTGEIITNTDNPLTDLNFMQNVPGDQSKEVIAAWLALKNYLLNNKSETSIISSDYKEFFKHAFSEITSAERIDVEIVMTVTSYDRDINNPYKKHGFKQDSTLENGEPFVNISAKLTYGQKTHYVTLATLGKQSKIIEKATSLNVPIDKIEARFEELEQMLNNSGKNMITLQINNLDNFDFITSTRLETILPNPTSKQRQEFDLTTLNDNFPGMNFSEIRFFPANFEAFKNLLRSYTFGNERFTGVDISAAQTEEKLKRLWQGDRDADGNLVKDTNGKSNAGLRNKPYIVVSSNNDLDGNNTGTKTQASIVMIGSHKRDLNTLISEINDLLDERKSEILANYKPKQSSVISDKLNAKTETLLNRSDILNVFIKWGTTPTGNGKETLLDLLFKEIEFSVSDTITGNKTSVFEIFTRFRNNPANSNPEKVPSTERMKRIIEMVKKAIADNNGDFMKTKNAVIKQSEGLTGWHWTFFNIFAYEKLIAETEDKETRELFMGELVDEKVMEAWTASKGKTEMLSILGQLVGAAKDTKFYYSIPIKPPQSAGGPILANSFISGKHGFSADVYGDKFFIAAAPESARILMNLDEFLTASLAPEITSAQPVQVTQPIIQPIAPPTTIIPPTPAVIIPVPAPITTAGEINRDLINATIKTITDDNIKGSLLAVLNIVSDRIENDFNDKLFEVVTSEVFENANDTKKVRMIMEYLGFKISSAGIVDIRSIASELNLDKSIDSNLILEIKQEISKLLKFC